MSGGSHGYIGRCYDMDDVRGKAGWLPDVADRLDELGHADTARATRELYERLTAEPEHFAELVKVWGAVDYLDSSDYGPESVTEAVAAWRHAAGIGSARPLAKGDTVHGFCGGIFGRDSYDCKTVEARGRDWAVFRTADGDVELAYADDLDALTQYRDNPPRDSMAGIPSPPCCDQMPNPAR